MIQIDNGRVMTTPSIGEAESDPTYFFPNRQGAADFARYMDGLPRDVVTYGGSSLDYPQDDGMPEGWDFDDWRMTAFEIK
tara:strand:- start:53 stop:292 length:240 start_codon:yes stop_codon:yes gene_type:complete